MPITYTMIRRISKLCKLFSTSLSDFSYESFISNYNPHTEVCPCCRSLGNCIRHGYYHRYIIHTSDDRSSGSICTSKILRVRCKCCRHTHAILPDFIIPYRLHSLVFIVQVLQEFFGKTMSINQICLHFHLSKQLFHKWKFIYLTHRANFLGSMKAKAEDAAKILNDLYALQAQPFLRDFFLHQGVSFIQAHANPTANSGQSPYWNDSDIPKPHNGCSDNSLPSALL